MGDRCEMRVYVAPQDAVRFEADQVFFRTVGESGELQPREDGLVELEVEEINYGGEYITVLDVPWIGDHGAGCSYPGCHVYCLGDGRMHAWPVGSDDGPLAVDAGWDGEIDPEALQRLREFIAGYRAAEAAVKARARQVANRPVLTPGGG